MSSREYINGEIEIIKSQIGRIVSDQESEKEVRKRIGDDIEKRLRTVEAFINNLKGRMFVTGVLSGAAISGAISLAIWLITKK